VAGAVAGAAAGARSSASEAPVQREAQEIAPGLFLGPHQVAQDSAALAALGVTHICSVLVRGHVMGERTPRLSSTQIAHTNASRRHR